MEKFKNYIIITLLGALFLFIMVSQRSCEKVQQMEDINERLNDEVEFYIDENGKQNATIQVIQSENKKYFIGLNSKDSTIKWLQSVVKEYKGKIGSAIVFSNETNSSGTNETTIIKYDKVTKDSIIYIYPTYFSSWSNKWEIGEIEASKDSIKRSIKIKNEYEITLGKVSNGLFKKKVYNVNLKNLNPNTFTTELRSFEVKEKPKRINLSLQAGYGLSLTTFKPTPYIGFGIDFVIIGIK